MTRFQRSPRALAITAVAVVISSVLITSCGGGGGAPPRTQPILRAPAPAAALALRPLYEAGRYQDVVSAAGLTLPSQGSPEHLWIAARSYLRLNRGDDARAQLGRLGASNDKAWQVAAQLATAALDGTAAAMDRAVAAAGGFPTHPFVQFELGLALAGRNNFAESARAMDRAAAAAPEQAYAYYYAGLAYQRLNRVDLTAARLETFIRLAPEAPERGQVESILRTIRGR